MLNISFDKRHSDWRIFKNKFIFNLIYPCIIFAIILIFILILINNCFLVFIYCICRSCDGSSTRLWIWSIFWLWISDYTIFSFFILPRKFWQLPKIPWSFSILIWISDWISRKWSCWISIYFWIVSTINLSTCI